MRRLYENKDPRILSVTLNQPAASTQLTNSTTLLNMQPYWPIYRAAGQYVVVIDSGIRKDHEFFKMNGASTVVFEACFGTNGLDQNGVSWQSICPSQNGAGDSPSGQVGSGEPFANLSVCNTLASLPSPYTHDCSHGTHVSGIAAGRSSTNISPSTLQGVAPDAGLVAVQVFSYGNTSTSNPRASAFSADILGALNAVVSATAPGTNNPFVVNMSLGGEAYSSDCPTVYPGITYAIQNLSSQGVPVVVSTGNNGNYNGVSWPACVPQTIKVASVLNDSNGTSLAGFSNIGNPASFTGPILLTPGGGGGTTINSSDRASTTATKRMQGTSQAAPHAAGIYAAIKAAVPGISVADATAWIVSTASIPVTYNLPTIGTQTYRRIRLP
jgi:subtilisin family serine protease